MKKVFLGGTTNDSNWRDLLIKKIKIDYFNPVVKDWNESARYICTITSADAKDLYSACTSRTNGILSWIKTKW